MFVAREWDIWNGEWVFEKSCKYGQSIAQNLNLGFETYSKKYKRIQERRLVFVIDSGRLKFVGIKKAWLTANKTVNNRIKI